MATVVTLSSSEEEDNCITVLNEHIYKKDSESIPIIISVQSLTTPSITLKDKNHNETTKKLNIIPDPELNVNEKKMPPLDTIASCTYNHLNSSTSSNISVQKVPQPSTSSDTRSNTLFTAESSAATDNSILYQKFSELFDKLEPKGEFRKKAHLKLERNKNRSASIYFNSLEFEDLLKKQLNIVENNPKHLYLGLKVILDALKGSNVIESGPSNGLKDLPDRKKRLAEKLSITMNKLDRKIKKLEKMETDLDDDEGSSYIRLQRYRERFCRIHKKWCELMEQSSDAARIMRKKIKFTETPYTKLNLVVEKWINETKQFPDFFEVKQVIQKHNDTAQLNLKPEEIDRLASDAFRNIGVTLQKMRRIDLTDTLTSLLEDAQDPAEQDPELARKLDENKKKYGHREQEIIDKFVEKQAEFTSEQNTPMENCTIGENEEPEIINTVNDSSTIETPNKQDDVVAVKVVKRRKLHPMPSVLRNKSPGDSVTKFSIIELLDEDDVEQAGSSKENTSMNAASCNDTVKRKVPRKLLFSKNNHTSVSHNRNETKSPPNSKSVICLNMIRGVYPSPERVLAILKENSVKQNRVCNVLREITNMTPPLNCVKRSEITMEAYPLGKQNGLPMNGDSNVTHDKGSSDDKSGDKEINNSTHNGQNEESSSPPDRTGSGGDDGDDEKRKKKQIDESPNCEDEVDEDAEMEDEENQTHDDDSEVPVMETDVRERNNEHIKETLECNDGQMELKNGDCENEGKNNENGESQNVDNEESCEIKDIDNSNEADGEEITEEKHQNEEEITEKCENNKNEENCVNDKNEEDFAENSKKNKNKEDITEKCKNDKNEDVTENCEKRKNEKDVKENCESVECANEEHQENMEVSNIIINSVDTTVQENGTIDDNDGELKDVEDNTIQEDLDESREKDPLEEVPATDNEFNDDHENESVNINEVMDVENKDSISEMDCTDEVHEDVDPLSIPVEDDASDEIEVMGVKLATVKEKPKFAFNMKGITITRPRDISAEERVQRFLHSAASHGIAITRKRAPPPLSDDVRNTLEQLKRKGISATRVCRSQDGINMPNLPTTSNNPPMANKPGPSKAANFLPTFRTNPMHANRLRAPSIPNIFGNGSFRNLPIPWNPRMRFATSTPTRFVRAPFSPRFNIPPIRSKQPNQNMTPKIMAVRGASQNNPRLQKNRLSANNMPRGGLFMNQQVMRPPVFSPQRLRAPINRPTPTPKKPVTRGPVQTVVLD